ncbi:MAG: sigma-70 family RNA polymerase sigma factor [Flavobacteriaceae bacterium]|nr:sigma-70 family RNA polymerase sigma factor [Flavobacteriaceae bacterium]
MVKKVLKGDPVAFRTIISQTQGLVLHMIHKMIDNNEDIKDLSQDIYIKVYENLSGFKFNSKLSKWIGTITYNTCINYMSNICNIKKSRSRYVNGFFYFINTILHLL